MDYFTYLIWISRMTKRKIEYLCAKGNSMLHLQYKKQKRVCVWGWLGAVFEKAKASSEALDP